MSFKPQQLSFSIDSLGDSFGRVFFYNDRVFRAIQNSAVKECLEFLNSHLFVLLEENGFIPKTKIADDIEVEGVDLILEHERLFETKPHEWSFSMLREMASFVLYLNDLCGRYGYELKDAHPHNFLFKDGHPVMVDIGSFQRKRPQWSAHKEFVHTFYLPLLLWSRGEMFWSRLILESDNYPYRVIPFQSPDDSEYVQHLLWPITQYSIKFHDSFRTSKRCVFHLVQRLNKWASFILGKPNLQLFDSTRSYRELSTEDIEILSPPPSTTKCNSSSFDYSEVAIFLENYCYCNNQHGLLLTNRRCKDVIELVRSTTRFDRILVIDNSSNNIDILFQDYKGYSDVTPLMTSIINPPDLDSALTRFHSDFVICLGIIEHYLLDGFLLTTILERIYSLTDKYIFIIIDYNKTSYSPEAFLEQLSIFFKRVAYHCRAKELLCFVGIKD